MLAVAANLGAPLAGSLVPPDALVTGRAAIALGEVVDVLLAGAVAEVAAAGHEFGRFVFDNLRKSAKSVDHYGCRTESGTDR